MPAFSGTFDFADARGAVLQSGPCEFSFTRDTFTLVPAAGPPLAADLGDIDVVTPGDLDLRLELHDGAGLVLRRFGKALSTLEHDLAIAWRDRLVTCLLLRDLDEVDRFDAHVTRASAAGASSGPAEIRLFEGDLAVLPAGACGFSWRWSDVRRIAFDEVAYAIVLGTEHEELRVTKVAKRTKEFEQRARALVTRLREREARTLHALFPFLSPAQFQQAAALTGEGEAAPVHRLRAIHPDIEPTLLNRLVQGQASKYVRTLRDRAWHGEWFVGRKVIYAEPPDADSDDDAAAEEPAVGETAAQTEPSETLADDAPDRVAPALDAGDGRQMLYWFLFPLGSAGAATHLAWEAVTHGGRATYVFRLVGGVASVSALNRGLVALNFRREPIYLPDDALRSDSRHRPYAIALRKMAELAGVREAFAGRALHTTHAAWCARLDRLLGGGPTA